MKALQAAINGSPVPTTVPNAGVGRGVGAGTTGNVGSGDYNDLFRKN